MKSQSDLWQIIGRPLKKEAPELLIYNDRLSPAKIRQIIERDYVITPEMLSKLTEIGQKLKLDPLQVLWQVHRQAYIAGAGRLNIERAVNTHIRNMTGTTALSIPTATITAFVADNELIDRKPLTPEKTALEERETLETLRADVPTFADTNRGETLKIYDIIEDEIEAGDYSVDAIAKKIERETGLDFERARVIVRTEHAGISNNIREKRYTERDPDGNFRYGWYGANDFRTTSICKNIRRRIATEGRGKGVPLRRLHEIVEDESLKGNAVGWKYRSLLPHINCRSSLVRIV